MRRKATDPPNRGDLVEVTWVDIYEHSNGDPAEAALARRTSYGIFWEERLDNEIPVLITTTTVDDDNSIQQGYCIYPKTCVTRLRVVKRHRK